MNKDKTIHTVRSSKYIVLDKKSIPIVAYEKKKNVNKLYLLKHWAKTWSTNMLYMHSMAKHTPQW